MLEVFKPASARAVDVLDDRLQAVAVRALRFGSDRVFVLLEALLPGPLHIAFEVIAQKVESPFLCCVHYPRLVWMQLQPSIGCPLPHQFQRLLGSRLASAQDHKVSQRRELPPPLLSEPDVNLSAHPAPIIQPTVKSPSASEQTALVPDGQAVQANTLLSDDGDKTV